MDHHPGETTSGPSVPFAAGVDVRSAGPPLLWRPGWHADRGLLLERCSVDYHTVGHQGLGFCLSQSLPTLNGITMYT